MSKLLATVMIIAALLFLFMVEQTIYAWTLHCPDKIHMSLIPRCAS